MHPYVLLLCLAAAVSAVSAGYVLGAGSRHRAARPAAALLLASSFWAVCEVLWNLAPDAESALFRVRLSAPGWTFLGPILLHILLETSEREHPRLRRLLPLLYAGSLGFVLLTWLTPWLHAGVERTTWGWAYRPGPLHPVFYAFTMAGAAPAVLILARSFQSTYSPAERRQRPWILVGVGTPLLLASLTDGVLPWFGVQVPRLGTTSFAILGLVALLSLRHFGYSFLTPSQFAEEIIETLSDGVALLQWNERIRTANSGLSRLSGFPPEELVDMPIGRLVSWSFSSLSDDSDELDAELRRADGECIPVSVTANVLRDRQKHPVGLVLVVRDLREVADLRRRLLFSARLAAVGELAAGIAHEINNPLAFVRANLNQLQAHWKRMRGSVADRDDPEVGQSAQEGDELIEESLEGVDRAAEIVRGVRGFSHAGSTEHQMVDLNALLDEVLHMAAMQLRTRVRIERDFAELPRVSCAPQQIKQVFLNLVLNAGQALDGEGTIRLATRFGGGDVTASVEDDGPGIPPEIIDRIFDPFFTTKKIGEGTGLGLGIAYQIVRSHGGEIRVESEPGGGARFEVRLPG
jgi:PAS domain S-box-containing protein